MSKNIKFFTNMLFACFLLSVIWTVVSIIFLTFDIANYLQTNEDFPIRTISLIVSVIISLNLSVNIGVGLLKARLSFKRGNAKGGYMMVCALFTTNRVFNTKFNTMRTGPIDYFYSCSFRSLNDHEKSFDFAVDVFTLFLIVPILVWRIIFFLTTFIFRVIFFFALRLGDKKIVSNLVK
ncbi:hypothetical protein [[Acholeplasma] multilocale]|uniref:hypothetical protein n=1 Tax=[Acholeplasma] multilocale TaxID=264638 RepID=UPI00047A12C7|nr:hypothetical protein [[Acholeplasma] multilocale]